MAKKGFLGGLFDKIRGGISDLLSGGQPAPKPTAPPTESQEREEFRKAIRTLESERPKPPPPPPSAKPPQRFFVPEEAEEFDERPELEFDMNGKAVEIDTEDNWQRSQLRGSYQSLEDANLYARKIPAALWHVFIRAEDGRYQVVVEDSP